MAAWEAFCDARAVTRPRPPAAGFFAAEDADVLFFAVPLLFEAVLFFAAGADFVLLAVLLLGVVLLPEAVVRGPLARVLAALLRLLAVVLLDAMVFAAWVLLEAVGFFAAEDADVLFFAVPLLFEAVLLVPLARVLAALLRAEALLLFLARVFAALLLLAVLPVPADLLVGICVSLLQFFFCVFAPSKHS